ncbi:MAG TPA: DUF308 domain-containing protein [Gammaproteobacteria bacterium]|nr:DUF308 domain-containing protein [Gammaproteobacteria bacterium]
MNNRSSKNFSKAYREKIANSSGRFSSLEKVDLRENRFLFFIWGVVLLILGSIAISLANFTTLVSVIAFGFLIFANGIVVLSDAFTFWKGRSSKFWFQLAVSLLYLLTGALFILNPTLASYTLTLIIGLSYFAIGILRVWASGWGWGLVNGLISILLGVIILFYWPIFSLYLIGMLVGIDLLLGGSTYILMSLI